MREKVPPHSAFDDDNRAAIDVQLRVLEFDIDEHDLDDLLEEEEITQHEFDNARDAFNWIDGEHDSESLAQEWEDIVPKTK